MPDRIAIMQSNPMAIRDNNDGTFSFTTSVPASQLDTTGTSQRVTEQLAPLYEDNVAGVAKTEQRYTSFASNTAGTFTIKSGPGYIQTLTILGGTAGAITLYDNTAGSGTTILPTFTPTATFPAPSVDVYATFSTGLTIVTSAATVIQVSYR